MQHCIAKLVSYNVFFALSLLGSYGYHVSGFWKNGRMALASSVVSNVWICLFFSNGRLYSAEIFFLTITAKRIHSERLCFKIIKLQNSTLYGGFLNTPPPSRKKLAPRKGATVTNRKREKKKKREIQTKRLQLNKHAWTTMDIVSERTR